MNFCMRLGHNFYQLLKQPLNALLRFHAAYFSQVAFSTWTVTNQRMGPLCAALKMLCILLNQDFNSFFKYKQAHPFSLVSKYDVFF